MLSVIVRRRVKLLLVLIWLATWLPAASAEAAFHLEYQEDRRDTDRIVAFTSRPLTDGTSALRAVKAGRAEYLRQQAAKKAAAQAAAAIPWEIIDCESGGSYTAENPVSSASGKYQFIDSTWDTMDGVDDGQYMGYSHASHAPPHIQDAAAAKLWDGGRGRGHWDC